MIINQRYLRLWCLKRGAALVYTSAALDTNCDVLRRCITWRSPRSSSGNGQTAAAEVARRSSLYVSVETNTNIFVIQTFMSELSTYFVSMLL